jgi:hypothetical protein
MDSFAAQQYALDHSAELTPLALTGTAALDVAEPAVDFSQPFDLSIFKAPFEPARAEFDYLLRDPERVDLFVADPRCEFSLDAPATQQVYTARSAWPTTIGSRGCEPACRSTSPSANRIRCTPSSRC